MASKRFPASRYLSPPLLAFMGRRSGARLTVSKPHPRVFAFDDAPFDFEAPTTAVVGLVVSLPAYVEGVLRGEVRVDGDDATQEVARLVRSSGSRAAAQAILLGGISLGGFNVIDLTRLNSDTGLPVITVTRAAPDIGSMERAIRQHLPHREDAVAMLRAHPLFTLSVRPRPLWMSAVGATPDEARQLVKKCLVRGSFPEPLRLAHLFASAIPPGPVSRSRA